MPIRPSERGRYPTDWPYIRLRILTRAGEVRDEDGIVIGEAKCEGCGVHNHSWIRRGERLVRVILTIAHLDHVPEHCDETNLRAWCQKCHNTYDARHRASGKRERAAAGNMLLPFELEAHT